MKRKNNISMMQRKHIDAVKGGKDIPNPLPISPDADIVASSSQVAYRDVLRDGVIVCSEMDVGPHRHSDAYLEALQRLKQYRG